jgi:16S rRNA U516 pseudouridylate synthase RsuA-like enzyme
MRLDQTVAARNPDISRRKARELIAARRVLVNDRVVGISSREVGASDRVTLIGAVPDIAVIAEKDDWVAVNKPAAMPTTPPDDRKQRSLEELLRARSSQSHDRPQPSSRLSSLVGRSANGMRRWFMESLQRMWRSRPPSAASRRLHSHTL